MEWLYESGETKLKIALPREVPSNSKLTATIDGKTIYFRWDREKHTLYIQEGTSENLVCERPLRILSSDVSHNPDDLFVHTHFELDHQSVSQHSGKACAYTPGSENRAIAASQKAETIRSPITGKVLKVFVKEGDEVSAGDQICIIEAMKMENVISCTKSGTVEKLEITPEEAVSVGNLLVKIG